jgi:hypothetical protein
MNLELNITDEQFKEAVINQLVWNQATMLTIHMDHLSSQFEGDELIDQVQGFSARVSASYEELFDTLFAKYGDIRISGK